VQPALAQRGLPPPGVLEVGVSAVDENVARLQVRCQMVDRRICRRTGLDHHQYPAGRFQAGDEILHRD
jgi:hypothetical protein